MSKITGVAGLAFLLANITLSDQPVPYAGQQQREIKALSQQEVQDYLEGGGMGLAKAAELNHFPGPLHVLQFADKLRVTREQKTQTERIYAAMHREAKALGKILVVKERELDRLFASGNVDAVKLVPLVAEIGRLQAELRIVHLQAHLGQKAILTPAQIIAYDELRIYMPQRLLKHGSNHER
jgi:Spy/CpxP family protein refolding chaperone